jgi:hypothetical protein
VDGLQLRVALERRHDLGQRFGRAVIVVRVDEAMMSPVVRDRPLVVGVVDALVGLRHRRGDAQALAGDDRHRLVLRPAVHDQILQVGIVWAFTERRVSLNGPGAVVAGGDQGKAWSSLCSGAPSGAAPRGPCPTGSPSPRPEGRAAVGDRERLLRRLIVSTVRRHTQRGCLPAHRSRGRIRRRSGPSRRRGQGGGPDLAVGIVHRHHHVHDRTRHHADATSTKWRTCTAPVAMTKSSAVSCCSISHCMRT